MPSSNASVLLSEEVRLVIVPSHKYLDHQLATVDQANSSDSWRNQYLDYLDYAERAVELADGQCQYGPVKRYGLELKLLVVGKRKKSRQPFDLKMITLSNSELVLPSRQFAANHLELNRLIANREFGNYSVKSTSQNNLRQGLPALPAEMWREIVLHLTPKERYEITQPNTVSYGHLVVNCKIALSDEEMVIFDNQDSAIEYEIDEGITQNQLSGQARVSHIFSIPIPGQSHTEIIPQIDIMQPIRAMVPVQWSFCTDDLTVSTGYFTMWNSNINNIGIKSTLSVPPGRYTIYYKMRFISSALKDQCKRLLKKKLKKNAKSELIVTWRFTGGFPLQVSLRNNRLATLSHDQWAWVPITHNQFFDGVGLPTISLAKRRNITVHLHPDPLLRFFAIHGVTLCLKK